MLPIVQHYIETHQLLAPDKPVIVGLSGGADSVALLALLVRLGYPCIAVHCNFHLRGKESDRDERFAAELAQQLNVPFRKTDFATSEYAAEKQLSFEMAARELRYDWFETMRKEMGAQAIAVAHHRDDSVETVLINMIRGTGIRGVGGIRPKNGFVVRPMLPVGKEEILQWLKEQQLGFVTDSTNLSDIFTRNFIRLKVIPLLEELNPSVTQTLARTAEHLAATEKVYLHAVEEARKQLVEADERISITSLLSYPAPETILYELLLPFGFSRQVSEAIFLSLSGEPGKQFFSSSYRLIKDREYLLLKSIEKEEKTSYTFDPDNKNFLPIELFASEIDSICIDDLVTDKSTAYFDLSKLQLPLIVRKWEKGDWFVPFGMQGRKKLSDYFSDNKFSLLQKENVWLLCSGDAILWIIGERADNRFRVNISTKKVLMVKFSE